MTRSYKDPSIVHKGSRGSLWGVLSGTLGLGRDERWNATLSQTRLRRLAYQSLDLRFGGRRRQWRCDTSPYCPFHSCCAREFKANLPMEEHPVYHTTLAESVKVIIPNGRDRTPKLIYSSCAAAKKAKPKGKGMASKATATSVWTWPGVCLRPSQPKSRTIQQYQHSSLYGPSTSCASIGDQPEDDCT